MGFIRENGEYYVREFQKFKKIFVTSNMQKLQELPDISGKVEIIPTVHFDGYHPDLAYVAKDGVIFDSPIGDYHSCIVYAAFSLGYSPSETESFFNERFFREAGFFRQWQIAKDVMFKQYRATGFSIEDNFYRWTAQGAFMHTTNHPKIRVLADLGFDILSRLGCEVDRTTVPVNDGLGDGPIFPIYPEIAALTGTQGSYRFKPIGTSERLSLREFIELSFAAYGSVEPGHLQIASHNRPRLEAVSRLIRQHREG